MPNQTNKEKRILCPTCGDVTNGHPAQDKIYVGLLQNGFTASYTKTNNEWEKKPEFNICKEEKRNIICLDCFWRWTFEKKDYCQLIENEYGGSYPADKTECNLYIREGTEPQWLCSQCGKNTFGGATRGEGGKWWHDSCWWKQEAKQNKELEKERTKTLKKNIIDIIRKYAPAKETAEEIMKLIPKI